MKKIFTMMMVLTMVFAAFGCSKKPNTRFEESREDETLRIMTSYIGVTDVEEGTEFEFDTREEATDFMYYWLDYGERVSGVIENTKTGNYYVTIIEERFDDVCREVLHEECGSDEAIATRVMSREYLEESRYNSRRNEW